MPDFTDVLFEVSSETRYQILVELRTQNAGITHISKNLNISQAEASRHFRRLFEIGIIQKDPDGSYGVSLFGELIYRLLEPWGFVSEHFDYFNTHDMGRVPLQFISRFHELGQSKANYTSRANIMGVQEGITRVGANAEKSVNIIFDEAMAEYIMLRDHTLSGSNSFTPTSKPHIRFRAILPACFDPEDIPPNMRAKYVELMLSEAREYRTYSELGVVLHSSEKEVSILTFPLANGEYDYLGFEASDQASLDWCNELFEYYWEKSIPVHF